MRSPSVSSLIAGAVLGILFAGCGGDGGSSNGTGSGADTLDTAMTTHASGKIVNVSGRIFSVPSPVETALLIKKSGAGYQKDRTLPSGLNDKLSSKIQRGLALGMYGADMAYVTVHKDGSRAFTTLQAIEKLGTALEIGNAFDRTLIDRYRDNLNNEDSLLSMSGDAYRAADQYLKTNERDDVSALVLAGGWIESMHLVLGDGVLNDQLATRVGEQKRTVRDLIALVEASDKDSIAGELLSGLKEANEVLSGVSTSYQYSEPITDPTALTTTITSKTSVTITAEQVKLLRDRIAKLRNLITA